MTQKEKLYKQYLEIKNEQYAITGETDKIVELTDEYLNSYQFKLKAAKEKVETWKHEVEAATSGLEYEKREKAIKEYYNTEEGKTHKATIEKKREDLLREMNRKKSDTKCYIEGILSVVLGKGWGIVSLGEGQMEVGYIKETRPNGILVPYFGHTFTLYYENIGKENERFQISYCSHGATDIFNNEPYCAYVSGMGKFVENKAILNNIKTTLAKYINDYTFYREELWKVDAEIRNPFINKDK